MQLKCFKDLQSAFQALLSAFHTMQMEFIVATAMLRE